MPMHFDQITMRLIQDKARALESARKQLYAAQKAGMEWDVVSRLQATFDMAQAEMVNIGVQAAQSLPRSIKQEGP